MSRKAIILTWTGFQDHEVVYPYYRLLEAGFKVDVVADQKDSRGRFFVILGLNMPCHVLIDEFLEHHEKYHDGYDLLVLPGGVQALEKLRLVTGAKDFIRKWHLSGKVISSTCHGAQMLISAGVAKGRRISGYYSIEDDITNAGAIYVKSPVVVDENVISSPHYDHMGDWMKATIEAYEKLNSK